MTSVGVDRGTHALQPSAESSRGVALFVAVADDALRFALVDLAYRRGIRACVAPNLLALGDPTGAVVVADEPALQGVDDSWLRASLGVASVGRALRLEQGLISAGSGLSELLAEIQRLVVVEPKRVTKRQQSGEILRIPPVELDVSTRQVSVNGRTMEVRRAEFNVLHYLMANPERVVPPREIVEQVLGTTGSGGSARTQVCELRRKLAEAGAPHVVETLRGSGYRFVRTTTR